MANTLLTLANKKASETVNLVRGLPIALDQQYDISLKLDILDGLLNRAGCVLRKVSYLRPDCTVPSLLWIELDDKRKFHRYFTNDIDKNWIPLFAAARTFYTGSDTKPILHAQAMSFSSSCRENSS